MTLDKSIQKLNRLRLRLGLFRWKNYAVLRGLPFTGLGWHWLPWWYGESDGYAFASRREAVRHIRRCVKKGVRP